MASDIDDPIKEAEVYAAYGRYSQAISILESAIVREPTRGALHLKLAEIKQRSNVPLAAQGRTTSGTHRTSPTQSPQDVRLSQERERTELDILRRQAEALTDPADRAIASAVLAELEQAERELACLLAEQEPLLSRERRERWFGLFVILPAVLVAAYFFVTKLVAGEIPNIFSPNTPYISWESDPYIFVFVVAFISILLFAFTCAAIGVTQFGRGTSGASGPNSRFETDAQKTTRRSTGSLDYKNPMNEKELDALERDARALRDPKNREEALKGLAELRAAKSNFELELKVAARMAPPSPDFKNFSFVKFVKLLFGAAAFLVLCASLIFLVLPVGRLLEGETSNGTFTLFSVALSAVAVSATILYLLGRKSKTERDALERNPIARQFAKQKFLFQLSALGLLVFTVFAIVLSAPVIKEYRFASYVVSFGFIFGYWVLGRKFWRCPACGNCLSFMSRYRDRQSIQSCPSCHVTLQ